MTKNFKIGKRGVAGIVVFILAITIVPYGGAASESFTTTKETRYVADNGAGMSHVVNESKYWAILVCGSNDFNAGFETDIRDMYQLLKNEFGYFGDNIYYVAPSNWNSATHYYSLSKNNIQKAIQDVGNLSSEKDNVFFFYSGHGNHNQSGWTIAPDITPNELDTWLDSIDPCWLYGQPRHCQQMVILLQSCYCGGFINKLTYHEAYPSGAVHRQRLVITSADQNSKSWEDMNGFGDPSWDPNGPDDDGNPNNPSNGNYDGSEFSSGFRMAFRDVDSDNYLEGDENPYMNKPGDTPDITPPLGNKNGRVSVKEAFNFSKFEDCYSVYWESYVDAQGWAVEYPQFWDPISWGDPQGIDPSKTYIYTRPPMKPSTPSGETNGKINVEYSYTSSTTDPDGDQLYYWFDWGDGTTSGWIGPYASSAMVSAKHTWSKKETFQIKVKAKDIHDAESIWSDPLSITMPYSFNKPILHFLELLFERFPNAFPILRHLLGY